MIYDIHHVTIYEYGSRVTFSYCALRLLPQDGPGQRVLATDLRIDPAPKEMHERFCFFGNRVTSMTIDTTHRRLTVDASSSVEVARDPAPDPSSTQAWEEVREEAYAINSLDRRSPAHFLHPSRFVPRFPPARDYAHKFFRPGRPVLEAAVDFTKTMRRDFTYDPTSTVVSTPLSQAFEQRSGVCQDFAHIMIAGLRGLGLPAAYVSGYIRTIRWVACRTSKGGMPCMPGFRSGAEAPAGSGSIRPMRCLLATTMSCSRKGATTPISRPSPASYRDRASRISTCR